MSAARVCLLRPERKAAYDATLRQEFEESARDEPPSLAAAEPGASVEQPPPTELAVPEIDTSIRSPAPRRKRPAWLLPGIAIGVALVGVALLVAFLSRPVADRSPRQGERAKSIASGRTSPEGKRPATASEHPPGADEASATRPPGSAQEQPTDAAGTEPAPATPLAEEQKRWAEKLGVPVEKTNSLGMQFVLVPPGEFDMGSTQDEVGQLAQEARERGLKGWYIGRLPGEAPKHHVRITRAFYLGKHEVTVGQFRQFAEATRYLTEAESRKKDARGFIPETSQLDYGPEYNWKNPGFAQDDDHPAVNLSWNDAAAFCRWLSTKEGSDYRLPTEAEWEYACRAGSSGRFSSGDAAETLRNVANLCGASCPLASAPGQPTVPWDDGYPFTAPVGRFRANAFGLCDMHGNAWEWCQDWYDEHYYERSPAEDPPGPESGQRKLSRGGSWYYATECARAANRFVQPPQTCNHFNGFRVLLADDAFAVSKPEPTLVAKPRKAVPPAEPAGKQATVEPQPEQSATQGRTPVPGRTEQEQGLAHFTAIYGAEWDKVRSPSEKQVLAAKLLAEARRTGGTTPDDFVLLEKTRELAMEAADASITLEAIDELGARFEVDVLELKAAAIAALSKTARTPDQRRRLVDQALGVMDEALRSEDFGVAKEVGELVRSVAIRLRDRELAKQVVARNDEVTEWSEAHEKAKEAAATLKESPDDPQANLVFGRYLCMIQGDWPKGLPHLAKGSDEDLKAVASQELAKPTRAADQIRLADAWWGLAEASKPADKDKFLDRAEQWYKQAEQSARSALEKTKILSRLTEISKIRYPNPDQQLNRGDALPTGLWIDLLRRVRLNEDWTVGEWSRTAQGLAVAPGPHPRVALPVMIDGEYDLEVAFVRTKGGADVNFFLPVGSRNCAMMFSVPLEGGGAVSGLSNIDGRSVRDNPTTRPTTLVNGQPYLATIRVRLPDELANIEVLLNGEPFLRWSGEQASLAFALAPGGGRPALGGCNTAVVFTRARLRLVSGEAWLSELKTVIAPDADAGRGHARQ